MQLSHVQPSGKFQGLAVKRITIVAAILMHANSIQFKHTNYIFLAMVMSISELVTLYFVLTFAHS